VIGNIWDGYKHIIICIRQESIIEGALGHIFRMYALFLYSLANT